MKKWQSLIIFVVMIGLVIGIFLRWKHKTVPSSNWTIPFGNELPWRAVHLGVNCCGNPTGVHELPESYFSYLRDLGVNWVGFSVSLHLDDSLDAKVKPDYAASIPTYTDEEIKGLVQRLHQHGFKSYMTLAFETQEAELTTHPFHRFNLGDPRAATDDELINPNDWPWDPNHPNHDEFVANFFLSYGEQIRHYGKLAEELGVDLFSIGTETDRLFQVTPSEKFPISYDSEIRTLVKTAKGVYSGLLTYDQVWPNPNDADYWSLWEKQPFDVIGLSAYPSLVDQPLEDVLDTAKLKQLWQKKFDELKLLHNRTPNKPIVFTEFGATRSVQIPFNPGANDLHEVTNVIDANDNGLDDGQEQQAHWYEAFFQTMEADPGLIWGAFSWGESFPENNYIDEWGVRTKLAEDVMRHYYTDWRDQ